MLVLMLVFCCGWVFLTFLHWPDPSCFSRPIPGLPALLNHSGLWICLALASLGLCTCLLALPFSPPKPYCSGHNLEVSILRRLLLTRTYYLAPTTLSTFLPLSNQSKQCVVASFSIIPLTTLHFNYLSFFLMRTYMTHVYFSQVLFLCLFQGRPDYTSGGIRSLSQHLLLSILDH